MRRGGQAAATVAFGILLALALLLSYIEVLLPLSIGIPGVKLGLANLASLICLYLFGLRRAALISLLRIILTGFLFGHTLQPVRCDLKPYGCRTRKTKSTVRRNRCERNRRDFP